jgi:hypothetical protein
MRQVGPTQPETFSAVLATAMPGLQTLFASISSVQTQPPEYFPPPSATMSQIIHLPTMSELIA